MKRQVFLKPLLLILALVSVIVTSCDINGYTTLGVANPPGAWAQLTVPSDTSRILWSASQLALNSDTWVYADNTNAHGVQNYTRFLTLENPDSDGVGCLSMSKLWTTPAVPLIPITKFGSVSTS